MSKMVASKKRRSIAHDTYAPQKEWDEALCAICMEHPHNAVLLICSSHAKGCRPYICDTSYRHSNCFDRYKKMNPNYKAATPLAKKTTTNLTCPLCRGDVQGWKVVEDARTFLNSKTRTCSWDSCGYAGNYRELRIHARSIHPSARPAEVDQSKQREWRNLEVQREYNDIVSSLRNAMPGAVVVGDYVIEDGNGNDNNNNNGGDEAESEVFWTGRLFHLLAESRFLSREALLRQWDSDVWQRRPWWENPLAGGGGGGSSGGGGGGGDGGGGSGGAASSSSTSRRGRQRPSGGAGGEEGDEGLPLWRRRRLS